MDATNALLARFKLAKLLNTDSSGRRIILNGTIDEQPALLLAERAAFSTDPSYLAAFAHSLVDIQNLGDNDVYRWYMANSNPLARSTETNDVPQGQMESAAPRDLKINLIYPCTDKHIKKYTPQRLRFVHETPEIYARHVRPYMQRCREEGRLNWVFNILDGQSEQENVLYRSAAASPKDDYLLLPDLNWDRSTLGSLHLLALVQRRDLWSVRDLRATDAAWLRQLRATLAQTVAQLYPADGGLEPDMLKFYVHYQPTYYHFHIHIVHVDLDAGTTQAVGKALGLDDVISRLESMQGGDVAGMDEVKLSYTVGEASELWTKIYGPLKEERQPV